MPAHTSPLTPHVRIDIETAPVRKIHIQNLTDLLHVCLLRGEYERARRAWAILIRCREVSWKWSWQWGLLLLNARNGSSGIHTSASQYSQGSGSDRSVERWLKTLRVSAKEIDKPALLLGLILHMIKHEQYRAALEELETYLSSYPYTVCGPLHTYAGLLSFYLAQPSAARPPMSSLRDSLPEDSARAARQRSSSSSSSDSDRPCFGVRPGVRESPNPGLLRNARAWFAKSLELDEKDEIATEYMRIIDRPDLSDDSDGELKDGRNNGGDRSDDTGSDTGDLDHLGRRVGQLDADEESSGLSD